MNKSSVPTSKENEQTLEKLPEQETVEEEDGKKKYRIYYLTIDEVKEDRYYGTTKEGTGISFVEKNLNEPLDERLIEGDIVKAYFDLNYSANGLVKVEKIDEMPQEEESS